MARDIVALVSADDVVAAVRVHADRIHDLLRRNGVPSKQALPIAARGVAELINAVDEQPETVIDLAGWWFGHQLSLIGTEPFSSDPIQGGRSQGNQSVLAGTEIEQDVRRAIAGLPRQERVVAMLRDAYDLPLQAVAVAIGRTAVGTEQLVANARLRMLAAYDEGVPTPATAGHVGRQPIDLAALSTHADGSADPAAALTIRRHLSACRVCEDLAERLGRARRLALGLPVLAMPDADRESLIDATRERAEDILPTHDAVLAIAAADTAPQGVPAFLGAILILVAGVMGVGIGVLSRHGDDGSSNSGTTTALTSLPPPPVETTAVPIAPSTSQATPSRTPLPPLIIDTKQTPSPTPTHTTSSSPPPTTTAPSTTSAAAAAAITESPKSGPQGTSIVVDGSNFLPNSLITLSYGDVSTTSVQADSTGSFSTTITASASVPGTYEITATDDTNNATVSFDQTL